jgi:hypothetical protein
MMASKLHFGVWPPLARHEEVLGAKMYATAAPNSLFERTEPVSPATRLKNQRK